MVNQCSIKEFRMVNFNRNSFVLMLILLLPIVFSLVIFDHGSIYTLLVYIGITLLIFFYVKVQKKPIEVCSLTASKFILIFIMLFFLSLLTLFISDYPIDSFIMTIKVFIPSFLIIFVTILNKKNMYHTFIFITKVFVVLVFFLSLYGITLLFWGTVEGNVELVQKQFIRISNLIFSQNVSPYMESYRIYSLTINPNSLGMWLEVSIPLTILLFLNQKLNLEVFVIFFLVQSIALYYTFSESSQFLTIINCLLLLLLSNKHAILKCETLLKWVLKNKIQILILLLVFLSFFIYLILNLTKYLDLSGREQIWSVLIDSIQKNLFLGKGFGVSTIAILKPEGINLGAHNLYLALLSEIGLIGFLLFSLFIGYSLFLGVKNWYESEEIKDKIIIQALIILIISYLIHGFVEGVLFRFTPFHFFWLYFVVLVTMYKSEMQYTYSEPRIIRTRYRNRNKKSLIDRIKMPNQLPKKK